MVFKLSQRLAQHSSKQLLRQPPCLDSSQAVRIEVAGRNYINFSSNDYLGLANHPELIKALQQGASSWGAGSGSSALVCGKLQPHQQLEQALAEFTGRERALVFSSGYQANLAVITCLLSQHDLLLHDRLNHASLLDAGLLAGVKFRRFQHLDYAQLARLLSKHQEAALVATDAVFSMDGDLADLPTICNLLNPQQHWLMVDDAHGFGVLGADGAGSLQHFGLSQQQVPVLMATLGKAFGTCGAFVAGSAELIDSLIQFARPYIYSTNLPPALACASLASLKLVQSEDWRRQHLQQLIKQLRQGAAQLGLPLMPSHTAIQPLLVGDNATALRLAEQLRQQGIWLTAIRPPTVPTGQARLRISLSAAHSHEQVAQLLQALELVLND